MSFTETLRTPTKTKTRGGERAGTILLTPSKRKRLSSDASATGSEIGGNVAGPSRLGTSEDVPPATRKVASPRVSNSGGKKKTEVVCRSYSHSKMELYQWTFTRAAISPCFAADVLSMALDDDNDDMYWLGNVPCRTAKIVGVVVGIDEFDDMTRLKVDDGTAVIDCDCKHPKVPKAPPSPKVKRHKHTDSSSNPSSSSKSLKSPAKSVLAKYRPPPSLSKPSVTVDKGKNTAFADRSPIPSIDVGMVVRVIGRVMRGRGSRFLRVEPGNFVKCLCSNDEPQHWLEVSRLHRELYSSPDPFTIPKLDTQQTQSVPENLASSSRLASPSASSSVAPSSPIPSSSPVKSESSPARATSTSPQKLRLRHPSKLRTRDLTDVTFRMYLKHYMDFAPPYLPTRNDEQEDSQPERCTTPTPSSRNSRAIELDLETPRPSRTRVAFDCDVEGDFEKNTYGFTLSYLRRVPVLAEMARSVVRAERKRRDREARHREKAELAKSQASRAGPSSYPGSSKATSKPSAQPSSNASSVSQRSGKGKVGSEPTSKKMKRLFQKTIRELYAEGSIVLWTGGVRHWAHASGVDEYEEGASAMWKTGTSISVGNSSMATTSTAPSTARTKSQAADDGDDSAAELSEPSPREEAYISVSATTMAPLVLGAIRTLSLPSSQPTPSNRAQPSSMAGSGRPRLTGRRQRPPTASEILAYLHALDMRWERLGMWTIEEALGKLKRDDRVYQLGDGRWALCV